MNDAYEVANGNKANDSIKYWRGKNGRYHDTRGENSRTSKLTEGIIRQIKFGRPDISSVQVAKEFNLSPQYVRHIRNGRVWSHVKQ